MCSDESLDLGDVCAVDIALDLALEVDEEPGLARGRIGDVLLLEVGWEECRVTCPELYPVLSLLVVEEDRPVVLVHHDAGPAPCRVQVHHHQLLVLRGGDLLGEVLLGGDRVHDFLLLLGRHVLFYLYFLINYG